MNKLFFFALLCLFACQKSETKNNLTPEIYLQGSNEDGYIVSVNYYGTEVYYKYTDDTKDTTFMIQEGKAALELYKLQKSI
jgi:uncharacterized protein YfaP (DUF2135 family)